MLASPNRWRSHFCTVSLSLLLSLPLGLSNSAHATGLPAELEARLFRTILMDTPEGMEFTSRLLGRRLTDVTEHEADAALRTLRASAEENRPLIEDLTARVREIDASVTAAEATSRPNLRHPSRVRGFRNDLERVLFIQDVTAHELSLEARSEEGVIRFRNGESHRVLRTLNQARASFLAGPAETPVAELVDQLATVRADLETAGPGQAVGRLIHTIEATIRAVESLDAAVQSVSPAGQTAVSLGQKQSLEQLVMEIRRSGVAAQAQILSPADRQRHGRILRAYTESRLRMEELNRLIANLPTL